MTRPACDGYYLFLTITHQANYVYFFAGSLTGFRKTRRTFSKHVQR